MTAPASPASAPAAHEASGFLQERTLRTGAASAGTPAGSRRWLLLASLAVLALCASASSLANGFAYDDVLIVKDNAQIHSFKDFLFDFVQGYWPREHGGALYRPLTLAAFSVQWVIGHGAPWVFHAVNVALYTALTLVIFGLALEFMPVAGAWAAAALFAVHPVHVEAVGNVVGQAELTTALAVCLGLWLYLRARGRPDVRARDSVGLFLLLVAAALSKENGIILVALLVAAELILVRDQPPPSRRVAILLPTYLLLGFGVMLLMGARRFALGATVGEYPALVLGGLGFRDRCLTMLGIVPEWARLLLWPAHLRADYAPAEFNAATEFGAPQALGLALVVLVAAIAAASGRRRPALTFGIVFAVIALIPVSNILLATGILLAERTLLLPSVGFVLAAGAAAAWAVSAGRSWPRTLRWVGVTAFAALLALGAARSAVRQPVWRDTPSVVTQLVKDAPLDYRGWLMYGAHLRTRGQVDEARDAMLRAASLYQRDGRVYEDLGQLVRFQKGCRRAVPLFQRSLTVDPGLYNARGRLYICLLELGDTTEAMRLAAEGAKRGQWFFQLVMARAAQPQPATPKPDSTPR